MELQHWQGHSNLVYLKLITIFLFSFICIYVSIHVRKIIRKLQITLRELVYYWKYYCPFPIQEIWNEYLESIFKNHLHGITMQHISSTNLVLEFTCICEVWSYQTKIYSSRIKLLSTLDKTCHINSRCRMRKKIPSEYTSDSPWYDTHSQIHNRNKKRESKQFYVTFVKSGKNWF